MDLSELIRNKAFLSIAGGVVLTGFFGGGIYFEMEHINKIETEVEGVRGQIASAQTLVKGTPDLVEKVVIQRETDALVAEILPNEEDINNFVRTLRTFEEGSGVRITAVKKKSLSTREKKDFDRVVYQLTFEGDAFELLSFMHQVESDERFMSVPAFKLSSSRIEGGAADRVSHKVTLDVETYVYEPKDGPAAIKIDGYDRRVDQLAAEIDRRKSEILIPRYEYLGRRNRRDPFLDPRTPAEELIGPLMTVEDQMDAVAFLVRRATELRDLWADYSKLDDFQARITASSTFEEMMFTLEEDIRMVKVEGSLKHMPAERRFRAEVIPVMDELRLAMGESQYGEGPSKKLLQEASLVICDHLAVGEFEQALAAFLPLESGLDRAAEDEERVALVTGLRDLELRARTAMDFDDLGLDLG
ncbi:MAG: hypothetical protein OSB10_04145, partial [Planctomycetota bacterium]|nr:hypothetical protein [Planctomycetota bacterium]